MNKKLLLLTILCILSFAGLLAQSPSYIKTDNGIIVFTDAAFTGTSHAVKLEVVSDDIIRVTETPGKEITPTESLIIVNAKRPQVSWDIVQGKESLALKTKNVSAIIDQKTGQVAFQDQNGTRVLSEEPATEENSFKPKVFDGSRLYRITQQFQTRPDDAWYGLGQHQEGVMNYRGQQVTFFQNNTEVAIPFMISKNNYGILWDNYSLTTAGDIRPLHPLNSLRLFSTKGEQGWLTASYANDKNKPQEIVTQRAESSINMEFLGDSKIQLPKEFIPATGMVTWEGDIASDLNGLHQFHFTFGGKLQVWIAGKLVLDRWRKAWNPA
ncbi:MAG: alpha-xylosidase, partial [Ginsengibacter sp.]